MLVMLESLDSHQREFQAQGGVGPGESMCAEGCRAGGRDWSPASGYGATGLGVCPIFWDFVFGFASAWSSIAVPLFLPSPFQTDNIYCVPLDSGGVRPCFCTLEKLIVKSLS